METKLKTGVGLAILATLAALTCQGQAAGGNASRTLSSTASVEAVREICDPHTGNHWLLIRDASHPGGPGRLVLVVHMGNELRQGELRSAQPRIAPASDRVPFSPVIHTGDRLIVEENTAVAEARLEAVALGPAVSGAPLNVRLRIGDKVVRTVALAPGRAALQPETEGRP
jgi:hypothetical protein